MTAEKRAGMEKSCLRAVTHFGINHQKNKAVEELSELVVELMHDLDGRGRMDAIREELADVIIMAEQLRIIYGGSEVDRWIERKLVRLRHRLDPEHEIAAAPRAPRNDGGGGGS